MGKTSLFGGQNTSLKIRIKFPSPLSIKFFERRFFVPCSTTFTLPFSIALFITLFIGLFTSSFSM